MSRFVNKERVIFALAFLLLVRGLVALFAGSERLPDLPPAPRSGPLEPATRPDLSTLPAGGAALWNPDGRDPFAPRREFTDLPPAALPAPPAPAPTFLAPIPRPVPAPAAAARFRKSAPPGETVTVAPPPAEGGR